MNRCDFHILIFAACLAGQGSAFAEEMRKSDHARHQGPQRVSTPVSAAAKDAGKSEAVPATKPHDLPAHPRGGMLGAVSSSRKDELTGREAWIETSPWNLTRAWDLPDWVTLTFEERVRYESYETPWINGTSQGQYGIPIQSVIWFQARPSESLRYEIHFWDARQYGSADPNKIDTTMVNVLNLEQAFVAHIDRNLFDTGMDSETKVGQMQMGVGSNRLIGIVPFKSTQFQYVGLQNRLTNLEKGWEFLSFANVPMAMLPDTEPALAQNKWVWNRPVTDAVFAGGMLSGRLAGWEMAELYFYYLHEGDTTETNPTLYTPGMRFYRDPRPGEFDYEVETIGQTGRKRVNSDSSVLPVGAIMQHLQVGYTFELPWMPRFLAQWDYASSHFDSLFPSTVSEFGPDGILALFARTNLNTPGYRLFLQPTEDFGVYAANRFWWMADPRSTQGWSNANLVDTSGQAGSFIGQTWELNARWDAHENLAFQAGWQVLMKGNFAQYAPGAPSDHDNVNYWFFQTQLRL